MLCECCASSVRVLCEYEWTKSMCRMYYVNTLFMIKGEMKSTDLSVTTINVTFVIAIFSRYYFSKKVEGEPTNIFIRLFMM